MVSVHNPVKSRLNHLIRSTGPLSLLLVAGCASGDGRRIAASILQGIGAALS